MLLVDKSITKTRLAQIASDSFGNLVKAVVDIKKEIMAIDAPLHSDEEAFLISLGSKQSDLWGINLYPELQENDFIEYDSMINLRPTQGNLERGVNDVKIRSQIQKVVRKLVQT